MSRGYGLGQKDLGPPPTLTAGPLSLHNCQDNCDRDANRHLVKNAALEEPHACHDDSKLSSALKTRVGEGGGAVQSQQVSRFSTPL